MKIDYCMLSACRSCCNCSEVVAWITTVMYRLVVRDYRDYCMLGALVAPDCARRCARQKLAPGASVGRAQRDRHTNARCAGCFVLSVKLHWQCFVIYLFNV